MSQSIVIYNSKDIEEMIINRLHKAIEPFRKSIDDINIRILDLENMITRLEEKK